MKDLGRIHSYRVVAAIPDARNGTPGLIDSYAIVGVDETGETVTGWAEHPDAHSWFNGHYFHSPDADKNMRDAMADAWERAGWQNGEK